MEQPNGKVDFVGNRTECALLMLMNRDWNDDYKAYRQKWDAHVVKVRAWPGHASPRATAWGHLGHQRRS